MAEVEGTEAMISEPRVFAFDASGLAGINGAPVEKKVADVAVVSGLDVVTREGPEAVVVAEATPEVAPVIKPVV